MITSSNPFPPTLPFEAFDLHSLMSSRPTSTARTGASSTTSRATASRATPSLAAQSSAARPGPDVRSALAQVGPVGTCSIMMAFQNIHGPLPHNHILGPGIRLQVLPGTTTYHRDQRLQKSHPLQIRRKIRRVRNSQRNPERRPSRAKKDQETI